MQLDTYVKDSIMTSPVLAPRILLTLILGDF